MAEDQKKQTGKKRNYKAKFNFYEIKGEAVERKNKNCPKCGPGAFLAVHKDRVSCGGCGYTEKTGAPPAEAPKTEGEKPPKPEEKKEDAPAEKKQETPKEEAKPEEKPKD